MTTRLDQREHKTSTRAAPSRSQEVNTTAITLIPITVSSNLDQREHNQSPRAAPIRSQGGVKVQFEPASPDVPQPPSILVELTRKRVIDGNIASLMQAPEAAERDALDVHTDPDGLIIWHYDVLGSDVL